MEERRQHKQCEQCIQSVIISNNSNSIQSKYVFDTNTTEVYSSCNFKTKLYIKTFFGLFLESKS